MNYSPPGSSVHGICQARVLDWGAIAFSAKASENQLKTKQNISWLGLQNQHLQEIKRRPQCYPEVLEDLSYYIRT